MDRSPSIQHPKGLSSPAGGSVQKAATTTLAAAWLVYRSFLAGPVAQVVPGPTREAVFQLFCDLRANVPKDRNFVQRHAKNFKPQTAVGWLALAGVLGYAVSAGLLVTTLTLGISVAGVSMAIMAVLATGAFLASALGFMAFVLFSSALLAGAIAFTALSGYVVGSSSLAVIRHIAQLVFGGQSGMKRSISPSEERQQSSKGVSGATTTSVIVTPLDDNSEEDKPNTPSTTRPSTYAAPRAVLPPIKTTSPTKKRSPTAATAPAPDSSSVLGKEEKGKVTLPLEDQQTAALLSPASSTSTATAAKYSTTPTAPAAVAEVEDAVVAVEKSSKEIPIADIPNNVQKEQGETSKPMNTSSSAKTTFVAIKTDKTTPSGTRTITMIKRNDTAKKTSSPAPLPGPPSSTVGLLKPISPASAASDTTTPAAQDVSFSSTPLPNVNSDTIDATESSSNAPFTSVMQGWREIEKKAALESPHGDRVAILPLPKSSSPSNKSKTKGKSSKKVHSAPSGLVVGEVDVSVPLDPKTPET